MHCFDSVEVKRSVDNPDSLKPTKPERSGANARIDAVISAALAVGAWRLRGIKSRAPATASLAKEKPWLARRCGAATSRSGPIRASLFDERHQHPDRTPTGLFGLRVDVLEPAHRARTPSLSWPKGTWSRSPGISCSPVTRSATAATGPWSQRPHPAGRVLQAPTPACARTGEQNGGQSGPSRRANRYITGGYQAYRFTGSVAGFEEEEDDTATVGYAAAG